ncbi:MAG: hypothetical protein H5T70_05200 [Chloroflexi bacterium]|nr:hypothetical protein [Chloroflexota bacterium]
MAISNILAVARDWGILILAVEGLVILTILYVLTYKMARALGRFLPKVRTFLRTVQSYVEQLSRSVARITASVRKPFIWLESTAQGLKAAKGAWSAPNIRRR